MKEAIQDLAAEEYVEQGLSYYDNYRLFAEFCLTQGEYEPSWCGDQHVPAKAEVAFEVLFYFLIEKGFLGNIDWASGVDEIIDVYNLLFKRRNISKLKDSEVQNLIEVSKGSKRGEVYMKCSDKLDAITSERGMVVVYYQMGWDAYLPIILSDKIYKKWANVKFGKKYPVIP